MKAVKNKIVEIEDSKNLIGQFYFPNTYYNSLDFIYKYIKEVIVKDIASINSDFFKKYFSGIEDHRFAMKRAVENNAYYNNAYPTLGILVNQDFSGAGHRTRMNMAKLFNALSADDSGFQTVFEDYNISINLSSNIYKYNTTLNAKFGTSFEASNFVSRIYNNIHINKHYYPPYSELRYRLDKVVYQTIRTMYKAQYENDEEFLEFMNKYTNRRIIREYDRATGNIDYFLLIPIRPLILVQTPMQQDNNTGGDRSALVTINIDIEIELPGTLFVVGPAPLLRKISYYYHTDGRLYLDDDEDPVIQAEEKEKRKDITKTVQLVKDNSPDKINENKVVTMPKVSVERIKDVHKKELIYETTLSISEISDLLIIDDKSIINFIKNKTGSILKIFDVDGLEIVAREIRIFDDSIEVFIDGNINDTIVLLQVYG